MKVLLFVISVLVLSTSTVFADETKEVSCAVAAKNTENRIDVNVLTLKKEDKSAFGAVLENYFIYLDRVGDKVILVVKDKKEAPYAGAIMSKEELNDELNQGLIIVKQFDRTINRMEFATTCRVI
jgi:hypothetical protein